MGLFTKKSSDHGGNNTFLNIKVSNNGDEYTFVLEGRLDTMTSPELETRINEVIANVKLLILELGSLEYISSAGLRVLLGTVHELDGRGEMVVRNASQEVKDIFDLTGFNLLFRIE